jgi:hypothetical protein
MLKLKIKKPTQLSHRLPNVFCKHYVPVVEGSVIMMYSPGGVGKSFSAIREAVEYVHDTKRKVVLWLTEDPEGENRSRYERIIGEYGRTDRSEFDSRIDFISDTPIKMTKMKDGNCVLTDDFYDIRLNLFDYGMVIIDPLLQFQGGDENSNTHAGVMMGALKDWADEEQKVLLLLHHASMTQSGRLKARGAGEWVNGTRGAYEVAKVTVGEGDKRRFDENHKDDRRFTLTKDNGLSYHFRDLETGECSKILPVFPPRKSMAEDDTPKGGRIRISFADHNSEKNPKGFEKHVVPFDTLHMLVRENRCYSPYIFADGHRLADNNLGYSDVLCLDFDGGMSLEDGKDKFSRFTSLIVTTRSHGKTGKGDRFRVFVRLKTPMAIPPQDHNDFMAALFEHIGGVDPATKDLARFFFASPEDAEYYYSSVNSRDFDWEPIYKKIKKEKVIERLNNRRRADVKHQQQGPQSNTLPKDTMFTLRNGSSVSFSTLRDTMSIGESQPVQCGKGAQYNAAAFVGKALNGNVYYSCSGGKCAGDDSVWCED